MRGLVKEGLTSNPVGFNPVQSAPSRRTPMRNRLFDARRGVEHCLQALVPRQGHCGGGEAGGDILPSLALLAAVYSLDFRQMFEQPPQTRQRRCHLHYPHHGPQGGLVGGDHGLLELLLPGGDGAQGGEVPSFAPG
jgi:hypothetical protein